MQPCKGRERRSVKEGGEQAKAGTGSNRQGGGGQRAARRQIRGAAGLEQEAKRPGRGHQQRQPDGW